MSEQEILIIDPKQSFLRDKNNKEESHEHRYYRLLWHERPRNQKQIKQYWTWIQKQKDNSNLQYEPPKKISTIYNWYHRWNWQEWEAEEITKEINTTTKNKLTSNANYTLNKVSDETIFLTEFLQTIQQEIQKGFKQYDVNNPTTTKNNIKLVTLYTQILKLLSGIHTDINDSYQIVRTLANETTQSNSSTFVKMLEESKQYFIENGAKQDDTTDE